MALTIFRISIIFSLSVLVILGLFWGSFPDLKIKNGFIRSVDSTKLSFQYSVTLPMSSYYFAGFIDDALYLGNDQNPKELLKISDTVQQYITIKNCPTGYASKIVVDSSFFIYIDLSRYQIYQGDPETWEIQKAIPTTGTFTEVVPANDQTLFLRNFNHSGTEHIISKENLYNGHIWTADEILQKQIDGIFCTDGILSFNKNTNTFVYTYFYRNQFIHFDTSLTVLHRGHTIDTTRYAAITVSNSNGVRTLSSPPAIVNRRSLAHGEFIFINSNRIADNENPDEFRRIDVIDMYKVETGTYVSSFYIPRDNTIRFRHFTVDRKRIYFLHGQQLSVYQLR